MAENLEKTQGVPGNLNVDVRTVPRVEELALESESGWLPGAGTTGQPGATAAPAGRGFPSLADSLLALGHISEALTKRPGHIYTYVCINAYTYRNVYKCIYTYLCMWPYKYI